MSKAMPKEPKREIRDVLDEYLSKGPGYRYRLNNDTPQMRKDAFIFLSDIGALETLERDLFRLSAYGREYYEKLTTWAPWYWFKQNAFAATVAFATIATAVSGIVFNALD